MTRPRTTRARDTRPTTVRAVVIALLFCVGLGLQAGCSASMGKVNGKPDQYYGRSLRFTGRISDVLSKSDSGAPTLFHLVSWKDHRVIVLARKSTSFRFGDIVRVRGSFEHDVTWDDHTYYDVLVAESVRRAGFLSRLWFL